MLSNHCTIVLALSHYLHLTIAALHYRVTAPNHCRTIAASSSHHSAIFIATLLHRPIPRWCDGAMVRWCDGEIQGFKWILKMNVKPLLYEIQMRKLLPIAGEAYLATKLRESDNQLNIYVA